MLGALALVLAIAAGRAGWLGASGADAVLLPFAVTFFLAYRPIRDLTDARLTLARASVAGDALAPLFAAAERAELTSDTKDVARDSQTEPRAWALEALAVEGLQLGRGLAGELSFHLAPGSILAVVGTTGSGKTTLLRTLLGLDVPVAGGIHYGAARLDARPSGPASRPFAWVPQDAPVLADTLDANIALAPGSDEPRSALDAIGATSLIAAVGAARVGAGGRALSGGERQWVALARAVATRLPVLLLDEPTSGLDGVSQARVLDAIARLRGSRTVIIVTHREEPLSIADAVLRLDGADSVAHPHFHPDVVLVRRWCAHAPLVDTRVESTIFPEGERASDVASAVTCTKRTSFLNSNVASSPFFDGSRCAAFDHASSSFARTQKTYVVAAASNDFGGGRWSTEISTWCFTGSGAGAMS